ncbi:HAMP domain-containing sensor histidine kinase [Nocardioides sp. C4-1]|uniref:sensor histidine kinase n=1 Tax=Nocardioides sp. C4-1 TaxID=3151851 RepID=UPI0032648B12
MGERADGRPQIVRGAADGSDDPRVRAVLAVLAGEPRADVATRWAVEPVLLDRWVRSFVEAGAAQVTNRPVGGVAQQRDRFLTTFMHGLRSPLAVAQMWVGLLQDTPSDAPHDPDTVREILVHVQDTLDQLDERTTDVELLTAAMLGRLGLEARRVTVDDLLAGLDEPPAAGGEGGGVELHVDPRLFRRVLRDLWTAAANTDPRPRRVELEVVTVPPWIEIRVVRRGAPVRPESLHAMFEPFDRADDDARVTVGLYLARALTVVHGGTMGVDQDDDRTVFAVRVPDARLAGVPDP